MRPAGLRNRGQGEPASRTGVSASLGRISCGGERLIPRGDKSAYTDEQKRKAEEIEKGYEKRGVKKEEAERRAWATVNKEDGGGKKPGGSGRAKPGTAKS